MKSPLVTYRIYGIAIVIIFFFTEIEREIRTTEEVTTLKTYKYEEYYTQPSYQGDADDKTIKIDQNAR